MLTVLENSSKVTLPLEIIRKLGYVTGDQFDVIEKDGGIFLCPVTVYSEEKVQKIKEIINEFEQDTEKKEVFTSAEDMFFSMGIDLKNVGHHKNILGV